MRTSCGERAPRASRTFRAALVPAIVNMVTPGVTAETFPWHHLRFQHAAAIRARLAERYAPATANKILATLRGVLKHAFALGLIDAERYERVRHVESIRGVRVPRGRALPAGELRALFETTFERLWMQARSACWSRSTGSRSGRPATSSATRSLLPCSRA
jgi:hypothetical protein